MTVETIAKLAVEKIERQPLTPGQLVWRRFRRHKMALFGAGILIALVLYVTIGALVFSEKDANRGDLRVNLQSPSLAHPFGTDMA
ncbi:MAG: ABC transporter permease, partial [Chloroflexi bacterium]